MKKLTQQQIQQLNQEVQNIPISIHCWQGDDVVGFEIQKATGGGIQATGNYQGRARNIDELMMDLEFVLKNLSGTFRLNLHACYLSSGSDVSRDEIKYIDFKKWIEFAKKHDLKIDFNPTFFAHEVASTGYTLSSTEERIRKYWVRHGIACIKIAEEIASELDDYCLFNIWVPDGCKEIPTNRLNNRVQLKKSLDEILDCEYDRNLVKIAVESKVFGIGIESYTVGSHEFYMNYAAQNDILCLIDNGHFHPTENVADKLSSMLLFNEKIALHVTRPVRWDSDHVLILNEELKEITNEIINLGSDKFYIGLDYFDASINRLFAWISGIRNLQKGLLLGLINQKLDLTKDNNDSYSILKNNFLRANVSHNEAWELYCIDNNIPTDYELLKIIEKYETEILKERK